MKIIGFVVLSAVVLLFLLLIWTKRKIDNGEMVKWDGKWMTQEEFHKIVPPQVYKVESKNKPEEVYASFRQALLANDMEKALGLIRLEKREVYRTAFGDKVKLGEWVKKLPEHFIKEGEDGNYSYYNWEKNDGYKHTVIFIKNKDGYWEIDQI